MPSKKYRATYRKGVLRPIAPLPVEEGATVEISITELDTPSRNGKPRQRLGTPEAGFGGWKDIFTDELEQEIYDLRRSNRTKNCECYAQ